MPLRLSEEAQLSEINALDPHVISHSNLVINKTAAVVLHRSDTPEHESNLDDGDTWWEVQLIHKELTEENKREDKPVAEGGEGVAVTDVGRHGMIGRNYEADENFEEEIGLSHCRVKLSFHCHTILE